MPVSKKKTMGASPDRSVFSNQRQIQAPPLDLDVSLFNTRLAMNGLDLLQKLPDNHIPVAFFDPQYRGILEKMNYGNEGEKRGQRRSNLKQMDTAQIVTFIAAINQTLIPSGHLFLWIDKFHLCADFSTWLEGTQLEVVDMVVWRKVTANGKQRIGMGYRTRRSSEYLLVLQKKPRRAKGVWCIRNIPDVWDEAVQVGQHTHAKPIQLQSRLIEATSNVGDVILDPAAGSFSVLTACQQTNRRFIGCDINADTTDSN